MYILMQNDYVKYETVFVSLTIYLIVIYHIFVYIPLQNPIKAT